MNARPPIPGPSSRPLIGFLPEVRRRPADFFLELARDYGDLAYIRMGPQHVYLVNHPDWIQEILVHQHARLVKSRFLQRARVLLGDGLLTANGREHLRKRRLIQPAFHRPRLAGYAEQMVECAVRARERILAGEPADIGAAMMRLTLSIVGRTLFSVDVDDSASRVGRAMTTIVELFDILILPFSEHLDRLPFIPAARRLREARRTLDETIRGIIEARREDPSDRGDLLSMLMAARDEEDGSELSDQELRDEALTLFLAGHETTANALTWAWYLLALHPDVELRFHEEIDAALGGRLPSFEDLPHLGYVERVLAEAMRLYPPAWAMGRRSLQPVTVGPWTIPENSVFVLSPYVTHRDPRWWPEPERFDPDRFLSGRAEDRPKFAYFPFGGGPRVCVGERFSWMEGVLLLATLGQRWRFRCSPDTRAEIQPLITLRPRNPILLCPESRS